MAISYVNSAIFATTSVTTSVTCNVPASVQNGDLLLWSMGGAASSIALPSPPAGWALWNANLSAVGATGAVFWYRVACSEPSSYTVSGLTSGRYATFMSAYRGVDQTTPKDATNTTATNGANFATPPAITPVTVGAWPVMLEAAQITSAAAAPVGGSTNATALVGQATSTVASVANPALIEGYYSGWASGAFTFNLSKSAGSFSAGHVVVSALKPAVARANFLMFA